MLRIATVIVFCSLGVSAHAEVIPYAGVLGGIATLSADAASQLSAQGLSASSYSPNNGGALNALVGVHLNDYFSLQGNYIWNENDLLLTSTSSGSGTFYEETRTTSQHAAVGDFLIYFRRRSSRIRPYLGTGFGVIHLSSAEQRVVASGGNPVLPPATFTSNRPIVRSHVGIDLRLARKLDFRYSFSEMIGKNDISKHLLPPAPRRLANFQNLFGFVYRF
jgi:Outer membrane protein beta-barrel domain